MRHEIPYDSTAEAGLEKCHIPYMRRLRVVLDISGNLGENSDH